MLPEDLPVATVRVRVHDVSSADEEPAVAGEQVLPRAPLRAGALPFEVQVDQVDPRGRYSVHVHVDLDGSGRVSEGDLLSTRSAPVLTRGAPDVVTVEVTRVG